MGFTLAILKLQFYSNISDYKIIKIVCLFLYWYYVIIFQPFLHILEKNRELLKKIDLFFQHGLQLGPNIFKNINMCMHFMVLKYFVLLLFVGIQLRASSSDFVGLFMIYFVLLFAIFGPPIPFFLVFLNLDPVNTATEILMSKPLFESQITIYFIAFKVVTFILCSLYISTTLTFIFITVYFVTLTLNHIRSYVHTLLIFLTIRNSKLLRYHITSLVFMQTVEQLISELILQVIVASQVLLTVFFWISVNCTKVLPVFFILGAATAFTGGLLLILTVLGVAVHVKRYSDELLVRMRAQFYCHNKQSEKHYWTLKWRACRALRILCGNHFSMTRDAVNIYVSVLNTNITNAVLLIIP